jgi:hypothetical protein
MSLSWAIWAVLLTCVGEVNMSALTVLYLRPLPPPLSAHAERRQRYQQRGKGGGTMSSIMGHWSCTACVLVQRLAALTLMAIWAQCMCWYGGSMAALTLMAATLYTRAGYATAV